MRRLAPPSTSREPLLAPARFNCRRSKTDREINFALGYVAGRHSSKRRRSNSESSHDDLPTTHLGATPRRVKANFALGTPSDLRCLRRASGQNYSDSSDDETSRLELAHADPEPASEYVTLYVDALTVDPEPVSDHDDAP